MNVVLHDKQVDAVAHLVAKKFGSTLEQAKDAIVDLATHDMTDDTYWRQGLGFVYVVYSGKSTKIAELCVDPLSLQ